MTASFCCGKGAASTSSIHREEKPAHARTGLAARKLKNARRSESFLERVTVNPFLHWHKLRF
jgi:hypothetical protein